MYLQYLILDSHYESMILEVLKCESITLDKRIDCVCFDGTFILFKKVPLNKYSGIKRNLKNKLKKLLEICRKFL